MYLVVALFIWWGIIILLNGDIFDGGGPFGPGGLFGPGGPFGPDSISVESGLEIDEDDMEPFHPIHNNPYLNNPDYDPRHPFHPYDNNPHLYPWDLEEDSASEDETSSNMRRNKKIIIAAVLCATFCFPFIFMGGLTVYPIPA
jgi:hypothetical protein